MTLFDAYMFIDWSAASSLSPKKPSKDAIWVGELPAPEYCGETYWRGREGAFAHVRERLRVHVAKGRRVLVGFDFPYGYPAGLGVSLGSDTTKPWRAIWDLLEEQVTDDHLNRNDRFVVAGRLNQRLGGDPGPFWGCPRTEHGPHLTPTKTGLFAFPFPANGGDLERLRLTEKAMGGVKETWQLYGAGSVGSQALVGIPRVRALRNDPGLADASQVWPFETGFTSHPVPTTGPRVLHAEIWPGIIPKAEVNEVAAAPGVIRDQAQVRLMCRWAFDPDREGTLGAWFDSTKLDELERRVVVEEEGWILGCAA